MDCTIEQPLLTPELEKSLENIRQIDEVGRVINHYARGVIGVLELTRGFAEEKLSQSLKDDIKKAKQIFQSLVFKITLGELNLLEAIKRDFSLQPLDSKLDNNYLEKYFLN